MVDIKFLRMTYKLVKSHTLFTCPSQQCFSLPWTPHLTPLRHRARPRYTPLGSLTTGAIADSLWHVNRITQMNPTATHLAALRRPPL